MIQQTIVVIGPSSAQFQFFAGNNRVAYALAPWDTVAAGMREAVSHLTRFERERTKDRI